MVNSTASFSRRVALAAVLLSAAVTTVAQTSPAPVTLATVRPTATSTTANAPPKVSPAKPSWKELTSPQQTALAPLKGSWESLAEGHKRKWIAISQSYPTLAPAEQVKLHSRMSDWAALSPQQRAQARLNFAETNKLTATEKAANWQAYQALAPEEKAKLAARAPSKPVGAAAAVKPVPPQKLAAVPLTRQHLKPGSSVASATPGMQPPAHPTMAPLVPSAADSAATHKN